MREKNEELFSAVFISYPVTSLKWKVYRWMRSVSAHVT